MDSTLQCSEQNTWCFHRQIIHREEVRELVSVSVRAPSIERNGKHIVVFRIEHMVFSDNTQIVHREEIRDSLVSVCGLPVLRGMDSVLQCSE